MEYRRLKRYEIIRLAEIDRSEVIEKIYYLKDNQLILEKEYYDMKGFPPGELDEIIKRQYKIYDNGGLIYGAFYDDKLIGVASLENKFRGKNEDYMKMDILFISKDYRGQGIAKKLVEATKTEAISKGARKIYVSATPSENTVNFYLKVGCKLTTELDEELYDLEPEDIHLELVL